LFAETLDEVVAADHTIRRLEAILLGLDWGPWEARYDGYRGQPPLHPRLVTGAILYGPLRKVRSSRDLEAATKERLDFRWFLEGRTIDHATFAGFRTRFGSELKDLFGQIARVICKTHDEALVELVIDGTRVRANSDRHGARTAQWLEQQVARCVQELNQRLARLGQADDQPIPADEESERLRMEVARLPAQVTQYEQALAQARIRDAAKQAKDGKGALPVRVAVTDPDSMIVPNKEGGFAPNYTPTVAVATGMIVSADVLNGSDESTAVLPALAQAQREHLARRGGKLGRPAFVYDAQNDQYRCPMGSRSCRYATRSRAPGTRVQAKPAAPWGTNAPKTRAPRVALFEIRIKTNAKRWGGGWPRRKDALFTGSERRWSKAPSPGSNRGWESEGS
jgi:transposase